MPRNKIAKVSDKLAKVGEGVTVYFYDNGYVCEVAGSTKAEVWCTVKLNCKDLAEVQKVLEEVDALPRD